MEANIPSQVAPILGFSRQQPLGLWEEPCARAAPGDAPHPARPLQERAYGGL
jgi:hypothetical protein